MAVHLCIVFASCRLRKDCWGGGMIGLLLAFPFPMFQCSMFHFGGGLASCGPGRSLWRMIRGFQISDSRVIWDGGWWAGRRRSAFPISFFPFHCSLFPTGSPIFNMKHGVNIICMHTFFTFRALLALSLVGILARFVRGHFHDLFIISPAPAAHGGTGCWRLRLLFGADQVPDGFICLFFFLSGTEV